MDEVLVEALAQTPEGQAFTGLPRTAASEEIRAAWESFTQVLAADYFPRLQAAAGVVPPAGGARTPQKPKNTTSAPLSSGEVPEFQDEAQAEQDIKMGRTPEANPEYQHDVEALTDAHVQLSECMPHWPVVF